MKKQNINIITDREFLAPLHGLRGIAALYVLLAHLQYYGLPLLPISFFGIGKAGVWIFFVLSAFLLTNHLYNDLKNTPHRLLPLCRYLVRRIFRIYPLFIVVLIMSLLLHDFSATDIYKHLFLIKGKGILWTIPVEFQYYLIIPLIVIGMINLSLRRIALFLMITALISFCFGIIYPSAVLAIEIRIFFKLIPFLFGSLLALYYSKNGFRSKKFSMQADLIISIIGFLVVVTLTYVFQALMKGTLPIFFAPWWSPLFSGAIVAVIYFSLQSTIIGSFLKSRILVFIGEISFSIYLIHMFIIRIVNYHFGYPSNNVKIAWFALALTLLFSFVFYNGIERPSMRLGKILSNKILGQRIVDQ